MAAVYGSRVVEISDRRPIPLRTNALSGAVKLRTRKLRDDGQQNHRVLDRRESVALGGIAT